ncbi:PilZ domain-containing protein [Sphingobium olei]|uniref:PilZ domain-containing protein n=1 Tax=Sphingobium olei TaxID=420955 RepID=A0ABW3NT25_9SPHN
MTAQDRSGQDRSGLPERRRHPRFATEFSAELIRGEQSWPIVVGDISAGGAMLNDNRGLAVGDWIMLKARRFEAEARIMWLLDGVCGIRFPEAVDPAEVIANNVPVADDLWSRMKNLGRVDAATGPGKKPG